MNWAALGAIAELIGGVAVLITLVYLATQVRQINQMQRQQISTEQTNRYHANVSCHFRDQNPHSRYKTGFFSVRFSGKYSMSQMWCKQSYMGSKSTDREWLLLSTDG